MEDTLLNFIGLGLDVMDSFTKPENKVIICKGKNIKK